MGLRQVFGFVNQNRAAQAARKDFLLSPQHFEAALRRERLRSDRSLVGFSLLTLSFGRRAAGDDAYAKVADILERRVRATDVAGWLDERKVGVILPDTPAAGAWKLADDLRSPLDEPHLSARFDVYVYPSYGSPEQPLEESADQRNNSTPEEQPLEMLFVQKLPAWKRLLDIAIGSAALALAFPVMVLAALAVKLTSPGSILYAQLRDGLGGRRFWIYKFRTMVVNADAIKANLRAMSEQDGPAFKMKNDPRVTTAGGFLRRTSIDELPQLWNVLVGDMTLVGPRPLPCDEARRCSRWQRRRLDVTPGLTCIWQVRGRSAVSFAEWMRMDLRYIHTRSLAHDLKLIAQTVPAVVLRRGAC